MEKYKKYSGSQFNLLLPPSGDDPRPVMIGGEPN